MQENEFDARESIEASVGSSKNFGTTLFPILGMMED